MFTRLRKFVINFNAKAPNQSSNSNSSKTGDAFQQITQVRSSNAGLLALAGSICSIAAFGWYKWDQYQNENKRKLLSTEYRNMVLPSLTAAKNICRTWTNSSCDESHFEQFAKMYAEERSHDQRKHGDGKFKKPASETEIVDSFRRTSTTYFTDHKDFGCYPAAGDFKDFLTFQWLLYRVNNISAERYPHQNFYREIPAHDRVKQRLKSENSEMAAEVDKFQSKYGVEYLLNLQKEIFKGR